MTRTLLSTGLRWGCAPSPWPWRWVPCSCSPSPSSATRCCSPSPTTTTSSGSTGPSSTVGARRVAVGCRGLRVGAAPSGSSPYSVPPRPLELGLPLLQHVPCLPHALRVLLHRVGGLCGVQEGTWPHGACPPPCVPLPGLLLIPFPQGIMARVYETSVVLLLLTLLVLGMVWVASAIVGNNAASRQSLYDLWEYYLPYLYSCISLFGVLLLLLCTPFGLSTMFTVTGKLLVKPRLLEDLDEQLSCTRFEEAAVSRRIASGKASCWLNLNVGLLREQLLAIQSKRRKLERRHRASPWQRNLGYPLAMLGLLALTGISVLIVCFHVLELLLDDAAMPRGIQDAPLGQVSFSIFGTFGAALQVVLIFYLMLSSVVGFYSSPLFTRLLPERQDTPLTKIIGNCVSLLVLSSALPVFSRTLGITRFDLLGDFGRFNWLGNFYIVFLYNMGFAALTTLCLVKKVTWAVQEELLRAFGLHKLPLPVPRSRPLGERC
uniref:Limb development membrane protein 1 like n=1 Tax=Cairina moschata TaxID=8855 RepID=A0A8C3BR54_CAIMO